LHFTHPDRGAETWMAVVLPIVLSGFFLFMGYHTAGFNWPWPSPTGERLWLGAATYGLILFADGVFISTLHVTVPLLYEWLFPGAEVESPPPEQPDYFHWPTEHHGRRVPRLPIPEKRHALWQWLRAVRNGYAKVSERGGRRTDGGNRYGFEADEVATVKDWMIDLGWYEVTNPANASGDVTDLFHAAVGRLAVDDVDLWAEALTLRVEDLPAPTIVDAETA
jgi:hypothetical protein